MRSVRAGAAVLAAATLFLGSLVAGDAAAPPRGPGAGAGNIFRPGAAGIGDSYFPEYGNGGYDVDHYSLELRYDPGNGRLDGRAVITATATQSLSRFDLDLKDLVVSAVSVDGAPAAFVRRGPNELVVTPPTGLPVGHRFTTDIRYGGVPGAGRLAGADQETGFLRSADGGGVVFGEPEAATVWFPVNDHPRDKATYDIVATVPDGFTAVAGGVPGGSDSRDGWTTWRWSERAPMASYLATVAIGRFRVTESVHNGLPYYAAVGASLPTDRIDPVIARTPEIVDFLASQFGPYPFDAIGAIVPDLPRLSDALETQTRPVYSPRYFESAGGDGGVRVIVHEMAHQWYGDSVSLHDWRDIWLNEGFATYAEWLWLEHQGRRTVPESFERAYDAPADSRIWARPPGDPGPRNLFASSVYDRGAMTLQALRMAVGDDAFFAILRGWAQDMRFGNGTTAEFVELAEQVSGRSLDALFRAWLYTAAKPARP